MNFANTLFSEFAAGYYFLGRQWLIGGRKSILSHIERFSTDGLTPLPPEADALPDEQFYAYPGQGYYEPGSSDYIFFGVAPEQKVITDICSSVREAIFSPSPSSWSRTYRLMQRHHAFTYSKEVIGLLETADDIEPHALSRFGRLLIENSIDREPVKYGLSLLSFSRTDDDRTLLEKIGRHEEFTCYTSFALSRRDDHGISSLLRLADAVHGWGRISVVRQVIKVASFDNGLREWVLREGPMGRVSTVQTAVECAIGGGLCSVLESGDIDDVLFHSLCRLFLQVSDSLDLSFAENCDGSAEATDKFLSLLSVRAADLYHLHVAVQLKFYIEAIAASPLVRRERLGWSSERCQKSLSRCDEIVLRTWWFDQIMAAVRGGDFNEYMIASTLASVLAIDLHKWHWVKLVSFSPQPKNVNWVEYYHIFKHTVETAGPLDISSIVTYAEIHLPLQALVSNPLKTMETNELNRWFNVLNCLTGALGRFPLTGWEIISTALSSNIIALRITAVNSLKLWEVKPLPDYIVRAVKEAIKREDHLELIQRMEELL